MFIINDLQVPPSKGPILVQLLKKDICLFWITNPTSLFGALSKRECVHRLLNLPTSASMTVRSGAAGNEIGVLNSNIWSSSTMKTNI